LDQYPEALAAFYYFDLPLNGPVLNQIPRIEGSPENVMQFKQRLWDRFPRMLNYSFDWGNAHFVVVDSNSYMDPSDSEFLAWLEKDLMSSSHATWKFLIQHKPMFFTEHEPGKGQQRLRLLVPLLEKYGVDIVFSGHVHQYQRSAPLRFNPSGNVEYGENKQGVQVIKRVPGEISIHEQFDPLNPRSSSYQVEGIIYVISGSGGDYLYQRNETIQPFTKVLHYSSHSFTTLEINGPQLEMKQVDIHGSIVDCVYLSKPLVKN
jgi:hypothetical protein